MNEYFNKLVLGNHGNSNQAELNQSEKHCSDLASLPTSILKGMNKVSNDIIVISDWEGKVVFISENVESILGYKVSDILGTGWNDMVLAEDVAYIQKNVEALINKQQEFNINIRNQCSKYIWFSCSITKVIDEETDNTYLLASLQDITNKKEAEEMMVRSEKMSVAGQLAAGVAHEIRNPLTSMKGFLQLLQSGIDRKEEYYKIMFDEIDKIETITSELLFISKPLTDNKQEESIDEMVEDVVVLLRPQAKLNNIEISWEQKSSRTTFCDRSQIKQILINLVKNGIEAMDTPGEIKISFQELCSYIAINVIDEGSGIPEDIIHKLGEPFFTTKQNGTGLGLMITKQILSHHSGKLEVFKNTEKGSTFQVLLPVYK